MLPSHLAALLVAPLEDEFCKKCWETSEMLRVEKSPLSAPTHLWIESHSPGSQLLQNHQVWEGSQIHHQWTLVWLWCVVSCLNVQRSWFSTRNAVNGTSVNQLLQVCLSLLLTPLSPSFPPGLAEHLLPWAGFLLGCGCLGTGLVGSWSTSHTKFAFPFNCVSTPPTSAC